MQRRGEKAALAKLASAFWLKYAAATSFSAGLFNKTFSVAISHTEEQEIVQFATIGIAGITVPF